MTMMKILEEKGYLTKTQVERAHVYRGLLAWGGVMVLTAPFITWLLFVLPG